MYNGDDDDSARQTPWGEDELNNGFWDENARVAPVVELPPEDVVLTNFRRSLADALDRNKTQLAATLQRALDDYGQEPIPPNPAHTSADSSSQARKTMRDISEGMCGLGRTFHQHMKRISTQRDQLQTHIEVRRAERTSTLAAMWDVYNEQVKGEDRLFE